MILSQGMKKIFVVIMFLSFILPTFAQDDNSTFNKNLNKSTEVEEVDGKFYYMHKVLPKQTLYSISKLYNVPVKTICEINNIQSEDSVDADTILRIPALDITTTHQSIDNEVVQVDGNYYYLHEVQPKQTLYSISKKYGVSVKKLCRINNITSEDKIDAGAILRIPVDDSDVVVENGVVKADDDFIAKHSGVDDGKNDKEMRRERRLRRKEAKNNKGDVEDVEVENVAISPEPMKVDTIAIDEGKIADIEYDKDIIKLKTRRGEFISTESNIDETFNVALLIPLYYDNADTLEVDLYDGEITSGSNKSFRFVQFYQGALMAIDSLVNRGMNINLSVFDVDEKAESAYRLVHGDDLKKMDLIIGPFYKNPYGIVCDYANKHKINIVNPTLTVRNDYCDNDYSFKCNVDKELRNTYLSNYIIENFNDANIIFYTTDYSKDFSTIEYISNLLTKSIPQQIELRNYEIYNFLKNASANDTSLDEGQLLDTIFIENKMFLRTNLLEDTLKLAILDNSVKIFDLKKDGVNGYKKYFSNYRNNVVISLATDYSQVLDNVTRLAANTRDCKITLFGDEKWTSFELDNNNLNDVNFHFCGNKKVDYQSPNVMSFTERFFDRFYSEPLREQYAYLGFDTFYYFLNMLFFFGDDYPEFVENIYYEGLESSYYFAPANKSFGYENFYSKMYRIDGFKYVVAPFSGYFWNNTSTELETFINLNH